MALAGALVLTTPALADPVEHDVASTAVSRTLSAWHRHFSLSSERGFDETASWPAFTLAADRAPQAPTRAGPDWVGLGRDTALLLAYQLVAVGTLYVVPADFSNGSKEQKNRGVDKWAAHVANPAWDEDRVVTPVGGAFLGSLVFEPIRNRLRAKLFGIKSDVRVRVGLPMVVDGNHAGAHRDRQGADRGRAYGFEITVPW
jgi:hypothetical protein